MPGQEPIKKDKNKKTFSTYAKHLRIQLEMQATWNMPMTKPAWHLARGAQEFSPRILFRGRGIRCIYPKKKTLTCPKGPETQCQFKGQHNCTRCAMLYDISWLSSSYNHIIMLVQNPRFQELSFCPSHRQLWRTTIKCERLKCCHCTRQAWGRRTLSYLGVRPSKLLATYRL